MVLIGRTEEYLTSSSKGEVDICLFQPVIFVNKETFLTYDIDEVIHLSQGDGYAAGGMKHFDVFPFLHRKGRGVT